jgi:hypothetical protein
MQMVPANPSANRELESAISKLLAYCEANDWAGYDPYDAVNSRIFELAPFLDSRIPRLVLTQALKRSPIDFRRVLLIPKTQNPKAIGLFLSAFLKLSSCGIERMGDLSEAMIERLIALRSPGVDYWCWGYSFPWQTRTTVVPKGAPNLVCTTFVAGALLDAYEQNQDSRCLRMAVSATEYILNDLYWTDGISDAGFRYPLPTVESRIHNANFLASALFFRVYRHTGDAKFVGPALRVARYSAGRQRMDGSWDYGELQTQRWIDNFHTGYNLCALKAISKYGQTSEFDDNIRRGFDFYRKHFFREDGAARYFHDRTYPLDVHSVAQSIITLVEFKDFAPESMRLAQSAFQWTMDHMWDREGYFYYRVLRFCTIRTSYMRWSQAWMLLAMSVLHAETSTAALEQPRQNLTTLTRAC